MKFRNVCVFFVKCVWSDWFLDARSRKIFMKILFSLVYFQIHMPDTLHLFSVFIFYSSRICPIFAFSAMWVECLLTCTGKPRFEPFFGFSRGFLVFMCYLIGSLDGKPAFLGNFLPVGLVFRMTTKERSMSVSASWNFSVFSRLPPRILMAVLAPVSSSWIFPDLYGIKWPPTFT